MVDPLLPAQRVELVGVLRDALVLFRDGFPGELAVRRATPVVGLVVAAHPDVVRSEPVKRLKGRVGGDSLRGGRRRTGELGGPSISGHLLVVVAASYNVKEA